MTQALLLPLLVCLVAFGVLAALWLFCTWYFADNQPVFGPKAEGRVTFKAVLQGAFRDLAELVHPITERVVNLSRLGWHNAAVLSVALLDVYAGMAPEMRDLIAHDPRVWGILAVLNLVARFGLPVAAQGRRA